MMILFMGLFSEKKDGKVHPVQTKWVWKKNEEGEERGVEEHNEKKPKKPEDFFRVFEEITLHEYNNLWGKYLELL